MNILGLDIATQCGWALLSPEGDRMGSGVWDCSLSSGDSSAMRLIRFRQHLQQLKEWEVGLVGYELVRFSGRGNNSVYSQLQGQLLVLAEMWGIGCTGVSPSALKKFATGKGNSPKNTMIQCAATQFSLDPMDLTHDEADALWCAEWARVTHLGSP